MKTNHLFAKVTLMVFAFFGLAASVGQSVAFTNTSKGRLTGLETRQLSPTVKNTINPDEFVEISSAQLTPKIVSCTGTSLSRRLSVQFNSQAVSGFSPNTKDVFYVIDDENYSGEPSNPFLGETPADKTLSGFVYTAKAKSGQKEMYFSNEVKYGSRFIIKNKRIANNVMYRESEIDPVTQEEIYLYNAYLNLETIYICDGIEQVSSGAFVNVPAGVKFKCVAPSKPEGWAHDWTDAQESQIEWGAQLANASKASVSQSGGTTSLGDAEDFILGYQGNSEIGFDAYPLTISYEKILADGSRKTEYQAIPTKHQTNPYDAVGSKIYGNTNSFEIIINFNKGESIDENSFEFFNIFNAQRYYIEEKEPWPTAKINDVLTNYNVPLTIEERADGFIPALSGGDFFYQEFEISGEKYLTIAKEFETNEEANALLDAYKEKITSFKVEKDVYGSENDLVYTLLENYTPDKYGDVYNLLFKQGDVRVNIFIQAYVTFNDSVGKYEFVTYIILDKPVDEVDEEGNLTGKLINSRNSLIPGKTNAIRPFVYVPKFVSDPNNSLKKIPSPRLKAKAKVRFNKTISVDELITTKYQSASKFLNYTSIGMTANKVLGTAYAGYIYDENKQIPKDASLCAFLKGEDGKFYRGNDVYEEADVQIAGTFRAPLLYIEDNSSRTKVETNLPSILAGTMSFRYTLTNLNTSVLVVVYQQGNETKTAELPIKSPSPVIEMNKETENVISFLVNNDLLEKIDTKNIVAVGVSGMTVNIHLYNTLSHAVVQNTQYLNVFGNIEVLPQSTNSLSFFDINAYLLLFFGGLTVVYLVLAVVLFFYKKNKYKNDEFRRMRPKAYIKSAALGYLGLILIAAAMNFIFLRFGVFNSTVPTYTPIDAFVIAFSIFGAIALGLFIKNAAVAFKLAKKRRDIKRLKLDKDVADDGTK